MSNTIPRRSFIASCSLLLGGLVSETALAEGNPQRRLPELTEALSPAELQIVRNSAMAVEVGNYFGKGYSCSEAGLMVGLRFLRKPEELVWVAGGFGGGIQHQDLCGFLTAGVMVLGLHAGTLKVERKTARGVCAGNVKAFWQWWAGMAPLHCAEVLQGRSLKVCPRLGQLASAKVEELIGATS
jgi:hypothetical protein